MNDDKKTQYRGKVIDVYLKEFDFPNGTRGEMEVVDHPGGAAVVAVNERKEICLLKQYRHLFDRWLWELPAGKRDAGEDPLVTAKRELEEEAGVCANCWSDLGSLYASPGVFNEVVHLYFARDLTAGQAHADTHENIEVHWLPLEDALRMARSGEIEDAKTMVALMRLPRQ